MLGMTEKREDIEDDFAFPQDAMTWGVGVLGRWLEVEGEPPFWRAGGRGFAAARCCPLAPTGPTLTRGRPRPPRGVPGPAPAAAAAGQTLPAQTAGRGRPRAAPRAPSPCLPAPGRCQLLGRSRCLQMRPGGEPQLGWRRGSLTWSRDLSSLNLPFPV